MSTPNLLPSQPSRYTRYLLPWSRVTKLGFPQFKVIRRPLTFSGTTYDVDDVLPAEVTQHRVRMRQFYEHRLIAPVEMSVLVKSVDTTTGEVEDVAKTALVVELVEEDHAIGEDQSLGALPFDLPMIDLEDDGDTGTDTDTIDPATIPLPPPVYKGTNRQSRSQSHNRVH
jgi:hypothetical protein